MKQCDYCGNIGEDLETVTIECYYSDGSSETIDLCPEHLPKLNMLYPPCNAQVNDVQRQHAAPVHRDADGATIVNGGQQS